jgi:hypothetical protein
MALRGNQTATQVVFRSTGRAFPGFPDAGVEAIERTLQCHNSALASFRLECCRDREHPRSEHIRCKLRRNAVAAAFRIQFDSPGTGDFAPPMLRSLFPDAVHAVGNFPALLLPMVRNNVGALAEVTTKAMTPRDESTTEDRFDGAAVG